MRIVERLGAQDMVSAALELAAAATPVFPCQPNAKSPLTVRGFHDATTDFDQIRSWWARHPNANIGAPTGALPDPLVTFDVLDVDVKGATSGYRSLQRLAVDGLLEGAVARVRTPSRGLHVYFAGSHQPTRHRSDLGLDFQSTGAYVLMPPSAIDGVRYRVLDRRRSAPGRLEWHEVERLFPRRPAAQATGGSRLRGLRGAVSINGRNRSMASLVRHIRRLREGERNSGFFWAVCRATEEGNEELEPLIQAGLAVGLTRLEMEKSISSAIRTVGSNRAR